MKALVKVEIAAAILSFAMIFLVGLAGRLAVRPGSDPKTTEKVVMSGVLLFFVIFGFACIGLLLHAFVALQIRIGNGNLSMIRFLASHETGVTFGTWAFLGLGTLIAAPFILSDHLVGLQMQLPLGGSKGVLVADIGMTIDEVKQRSTYKMKEPRLMGDGKRMAVEDAVFDYQIGDSAVRFAQSRYFWIETGPNRDPHVLVLNIGVTPRKMSKTDLDALQRTIQSQLLADGWMPGHVLAKSEETVRLWGGRRTAGDGRYWGKGNTLLIFERNRMDEEKRGEAPGSGEYILYLNLRPKSSHEDLVYERSAWPE